ncbi:hypothetical protein VNO80_29368 [Phaseolus coccineus]|uniref:Uncharacterized protein n=1 Tax=Phaseolus coccineus TaxID=3886 RepID=A0AAN9QEU6_PHACN
MTTAYTSYKNGAAILDVATGQPATPFDYGAGHVDPVAALDPGLVDDANVEDYLGFLCALNFKLQCQIIFSFWPLHKELAMFVQKTCRKSDKWIRESHQSKREVLLSAHKPEHVKVGLSSSRDKDGSAQSKQLCDIVAVILSSVPF